MATVVTEVQDDNKEVKLDATEASQGKSFIDELEPDEEETGKDGEGDGKDHIAEPEDEAVEGEIVGEKSQPPQNNAVFKTCPYCLKQHPGRYPKCLDCWKKERNGERLVKQETKTLTNEFEPPFK